MIFFKYIIYFPLLLRYILAKNKATIKKDLYANFKNTDNLPADFINRISLDKYFRSLFYFRTPGFFTNVLRVFYPKEKYFIIDVNSKIGGGLRLAHPYATIINAEEIGENVYINHLVTIGEINGLKPKIGNNVELHANCIVIGGIEIGNNVVIGAGAVVTKNIPENAVVVSSQIRILNV